MSPLSSLRVVGVFGVGDQPKRRNSTRHKLAKRKASKTSTDKSEFKTEGLSSFHPEVSECSEEGRGADAQPYEDFVKLMCSKGTL